MTDTSNEKNDSYLKLEAELLGDHPQLSLSTSTVIFNLLSSGRTFALLDLRSDEEYERGHIKSAVPLSQKSHVAHLRDQTYCYDSPLFLAFALQYPFLVVVGRSVFSKIQSLEEELGEDVIREKLARQEALDRQASLALPPPPPPPPPPSAPPPPAAPPVKRPAYDVGALKLQLYYGCLRGLAVALPESKLVTAETKGTRSAVFAPVQPEAAVVVEEEEHLIFPSCVVEGRFYQGSLESVSKLRVLNSLGVRLVVCAAAELLPLFPGQFDYVHLPVDDTPREDILSHFEDVYRRLDQAFERQEPVLVHCAMGISRSSTITIMFLMRKFGLSSQQAFAILQKRRPFVQPNPGFRLQLEQWAQISQSL